MARPIKCEQAEVLEKATALFWERGYSRVSISDLVKETGLLAGSLYGRFGSKEGLLLACIHHYAKKSEEIYNRADKVESPLARLETLFDEIARDASDAEKRWGCFLMNCATDVAPGNEVVAAETRKYREESEAWMERTLSEAITQGELGDSLDVTEMTVNLFGIIYAMRSMSRAQDSPERIIRFKDSVLPALLDPWKTELAT